VVALTESGAPRGEKHLLLWNPPVVNPDLGLRASARSQSTRIARLATRLGLKNILFARSRLMVEVLTKYLKDVFDADPRRPPRVAAYRAPGAPISATHSGQLPSTGSVETLAALPLPQEALPSLVDPTVVPTKMPLSSPVHNPQSQEQRWSVTRYPAGHCRLSALKSLPGHHSEMAVHRPPHLRPGYTARYGQAYPPQKPET